MADMIPQGTQENGVANGHEDGDANIRAVVGTMTVILVSAAVVAGMLIPFIGYFTKREEAKDAGTPAMFMRRMVPPKPRLLPSPFDSSDDAKSPSVNLSSPNGRMNTSAGQMNPQTMSREEYDKTSDDLLPWDKMRDESSRDEALADTTHRDARTGTVSMPIERAIDLMAVDGNKGKTAGTGTAGGASGQGSKTSGAHGSGGAMSTHGRGSSPTQGDNVHSTAAKQSGAEQSGIGVDMPAYYGPIYSDSYKWENPEHKMNSDSSGGRTLQRD